MEREQLFDLLAELDRAFAGLRGRYPEEVRCRPGCADCCHALFTVSYAEGALIGEYLNSVEEGVLRDLRLQGERAAATFAALREQEQRQGDGRLMSEGRVRCPMLAEDGLCRVYPVRPATCRVYGLPTEISGRGHVCGFSGFVPGRQYPSVRMDRINELLGELSLRLAGPADSNRGLGRYFLWQVLAGG